VIGSDTVAIHNEDVFVLEVISNSAPRGEEGRRDILTHLPTSPGGNPNISSGDIVEEACHCLTKSRTNVTT
jgi:hypothetical protein